MPAVAAQVVRAADGARQGAQNVAFCRKGGLRREGTSDKLRLRDSPQNGSPLLFKQGKCHEQERLKN